MGLSKIIGNMGIGVVSRSKMVGNGTVKERQKFGIANRGSFSN